MKKKLFSLLSIMVVSMLLLTCFSVLSAELANAKKEDEELEADPFVCCFAYGTKITMADGSEKNIEEILPGDRLMSYDVKTDEFTSFTVTGKARVFRPVYSINNGLLRLTEDHPLYMKKSDGKVGWGSIIPMPTHVRLRGQNIYKLEVGDSVFTEDGEWIEITDISFDDTVIKVRNIFSKSGKATYFANGVLAYEENPYPRYMIRYFLYHLFEKIPALEKYKDIFLF